MPKAFKITYAPSKWTAPPGGLAAAWSQPYGGLNVQTPESEIGPNFSPALNNVMMRNSELRSRPSFSFFLPGPDGTNPVLGAFSFFSRHAIWHTCVWTVNGIFQLQPNANGLLNQGQSPWVPLGGPQMDPNTNVRAICFQNILYYTNNNGHLSSWDGASASPITDVAFQGTNVPPHSNNVTYGAVFIGELDNHILLANTTEVQNNVVSAFPQRLRWSNNGFNPFSAGGIFGGNLGTAGATFDPAVNINSGFTDFLDVPDSITGMLFIGRVGYMFRQHGITEITTSGKGIAPFDFNHLWASNEGIGNVFPSTIAQYGSIGMFVAEDNVYQITSGTVQGVGGGARDAIITDIANAIGTPQASIIPKFNDGFIYLTYHLSVPLAQGTRTYVYSLEDSNWSAWSVSGKILAAPATCQTGNQVVIGIARTGATGAFTPGSAPPSTGTKQTPQGGTGPHFPQFNPNAGGFDRN